MARKGTNPPPTYKRPPAPRNPPRVAGIVDRPSINTRTDAVLRKINEALAWGVPDRESVGYTHRAFVDVLREARDEIIRLQGLSK